MSQPDEQHLEEEDVAVATSEDSDESPEVEGHIWLRDADKAGDTSRTTRA